MSVVRTSTPVKRIVALTLGALSGAGTAFAVVTFASSSGATAPLRAPPELSAHHDAVRASLATASEEWCGTYAWSNGFERHALLLGPGDFTFEARGCEGITEYAFGSVASVEGARVRLSVTEHVVRDDSGPARGGCRDFAFSAELYVVPWGDERYLVPRDLMRELCSLAEADGYDAMKFVDYPLRVSVASQPSAETQRHGRSPAGLPVVPDEFRAYLPE